MVHYCFLLRRYILWLFFSGGMLMPALIPQSVLKAAQTKDIREAATNGWDVQVRGRVVEHLEWFAETYMPEGSYSKIYKSPDKDYTCRFYCSKEDFAIGVFNATMDMDYTKFKETSRDYPWGEKYHDLLLRVWSASASVFGAGGFYGPRSKNNPRGYGKARKRGNPRKDWGRYDKPVGSTFFEDEDDFPEWGSRYTKSIHDMSDDELRELESRF